MILVTGTTGFIGKKLQISLQTRGIDFIAFSGDITDTSMFPLEHFDSVIHLAALVTHKNNWTQSQMRAVNVQGTRSLLEAYPKAKMVYISTTDVERSFLTPYAETKKEAEYLVLQKKQNAVIRIPSVFGPDQIQDKLIPRLIKHYFYNQEFNLTSNDVREYVFIDDVVTFIIEHKESSGVIRMKGIEISNNQVRSMVEAIYQKRNMQGIREREKQFFDQLKLCCPNRV